MLEKETVSAGNGSHQRRWLSLPRSLAAVWCNRSAAQAVLIYSAALSTLLTSAAALGFGLWMIWPRLSWDAGDFGELVLATFGLLVINGLKFGVPCCLALVLLKLVRGAIPALVYLAVLVPWTVYSIYMWYWFMVVLPGDAQMPIAIVFQAMRESWWTAIIVLVFTVSAQLCWRAWDWFVRARAVKTQ